MTRIGIILIFGILATSSSLWAQAPPPKEMDDVEVMQPSTLEAATGAMDAALETSEESVSDVETLISEVTEPLPAETEALPAVDELLESQAGLEVTDEPISDIEEEIGMERLDEEVATSDATEIEVDADAILRKAELDAFLSHLREIKVVDVIRSRSGRLKDLGFSSEPDGTYLDLTPHLESRAWKDAISHFEGGSCKDALKSAEEALKEVSKPSAAIQYAHARFQICGGKEAEGRATLKALALRPDAIGTLARKRLGMKVERVEEEEGAYLSEKLNDAKSKARKDIVGALKQLETLHGELINSWDKYRVRLTQAEILEAAGRIDEAGNAYLELYRKTRGWKVNGSIEDKIQALERRHKKTFLTYGERIDRMRHLVARGRYRDARQVSIENAKIRRVSGAEIRGWTRYREALQAERDKKRDKANKLFAEAEKLVRDPEVRVRLYIGWARALRRTNQDTKAIALYERLCKEYNEHYLCEEAMYDAGRLLQFQNEHERALEKFMGVLSRPESEYTADALWRSGFSYHLTGQWERSIAQLERLKNEYGSERDESELTQGLKARYWIAMNHYRAGNQAKARTAFQETIENGKLTWYGRLAAARMEEAGWVPVVRIPRGNMKAEDLEDLAGLKIPHHPRLEVAQELVRIGFWKDALSELKVQTAILPVPDGAHTMLSSVHLARGDASWAHWTMKKHISESGPTTETLRDWGTAFPLAYMDLARKHSGNAGVSPYLVQAIMRQESGFRPTVKSWAGAVGLMQLMPGTAAWTSRTFMEDRKFSRSQLLDTDTNVRLGSMYIRVHTAHSKDHVPMALAGYNAGAGALKSWFTRYGDRETDAFVESITYQEARGYVRKVMTSYITYSALYGGGLIEVPLTLPDSLGKWGEVPEAKPPAVSFNQRIDSLVSFAH